MRRLRFAAPSHTHRVWWRSDTIGAVQHHEWYTFPGHLYPSIGIATETASPNYSRGAAGSAIFLCKSSAAHRGIRTVLDPAKIPRRGQQLVTLGPKGVVLRVRSMQRSFGSAKKLLTVVTVTLYTVKPRPHDSCSAVAHSMCLLHSTESSRPAEGLGNVWSTTSTPARMPRHPRWSLSPMTRNGRRVPSRASSVRAGLPSCTRILVARRSSLREKRDPMR